MINIKNDSLYCTDYSIILFFHLTIYFYNAIIHLNCKNEKESIDKMKKNLLKILSLLTAFSVIILCFGEAALYSRADDQKSIVVTIFPENDWVENILGDNPGNIDVKMLFDKGVDPHSYQPSAEDILKIASCDLFIYVGGESDKWVEDAMKVAVNDSMTDVKLLDVLNDNLKDEVIVEGMQVTADQDYDAETDEHVWLSLRNAEKICRSIEEAIESLDPDNADLYRNNLEDYIEKIIQLDEKYTESLRSAEKDTVIFGDRFPFLYLMEDYGINYYAAFSGCSAETEAGFDTIIFLASKIDELDLDYILTIDGSDRRIAETVVRNTADKDQAILTLDSMQSKSSADIENGVTYLSIMESDLEVLEQALGYKGE